MWTKQKGINNVRYCVYKHVAYLFSRDLQKLLAVEFQLPQLVFTILNLQHRDSVRLTDQA